MKILNVKVESLKVADYVPREDEIGFLLCIDDGNRREMPIRLKIADPEAGAAKVMSEMRQFLRRKNYEFSNDSGMLANYINIIIEDDTEVQKRIAFHLSEIFNMAESIKGIKAAEGYLQRIDRIKRFSAAL